MARGLKIRIYEEEVLYRLCSENNGYHAASLGLSNVSCFLYTNTFWLRQCYKLSEDIRHLKLANPVLLSLFMSLFNCLKFLK